MPPVPVVTLPANAAGRDFVVGDIHGTFDLVIEAMRGVSFDPARDRILSVGDLIDRGPSSPRAARFLAQPYVHAVRGNHEGLLIEAYADGEPDRAILDFLGCRNGFGWWLGADPGTRASVLAAVRAMPSAIQVGEGPDAFGLVHANVPRGLDWPSFLEGLRAGDAELADEATWDRDRVDRSDATVVEGIGRVFVGHVPVPAVLRLGNVLAIDTGAVFGLRDPGRGHLTFADASSPALAAEPRPPGPR